MSTSVSEGADVVMWRQARVHLQRVLAVAEGLTDRDNPVRIPQRDLRGKTGSELRRCYDTAVYPAARELARHTRRALVRARAAEAHARGVPTVDLWVSDPADTPADTADTGVDAEQGVAA